MPLTLETAWDDTRIAHNSFRIGIEDIKAQGEKLRYRQQLAANASPSIATIDYSWRNLWMCKDHLGHAPTMERQFLKTTSRLSQILKRQANERRAPRIRRLK